MLKQLVYTLLAILTFACAPDEAGGDVSDGDAFGNKDSIQNIDIQPIEGTELSQDIAAYRTVVNIIRETGLAQNFVILPGEVNDVVAYIENNERILAYNPEFMDKVKGDTTWRGISVLAREIGHHLGNHKLEDGKPSVTEELDADKYAGFVLQKMGATVEEAISALEMVVKEDTAKYGLSKNSRIAALVKGYKNAQSLNTDTTMVASIIPDDSDQNTQNKLPNRVRPEYIYKVFLAVDTTFYFIDDQNLVFVEEGGKPSKVGEKRESNKPGFDWIFVKEEDSYGVDLKGRLWAFSIDGNFHVVGQAIKINMN
jgi:hypothetical protein